MILKAKGTSNGFDFTLALTLFSIDMTVSGVADLVSQTQGLCPNSDLQELVVCCHGVGGVIHLGDDSMGGISLPGADPYTRFAPLWSVFASASTGTPRLIFEVCEAGKNPDLLLAIASTISHPVYACTGDVRPALGLSDYGWWSGDTVVANPGASALVNLGSGNQIPATPQILN